MLVDVTIETKTKSFVQINQNGGYDVTCMKTKHMTAMLVDMTTTTKEKRPTFFFSSQSRWMNFELSLMDGISRIQSLFKWNSMGFNWSRRDTSLVCGCGVISWIATSGCIIITLGEEMFLSFFWFLVQPSNSCAITAGHIRHSFPEGIAPFASHAGYVVRHVRLWNWIKNRSYGKCFIL